MKPRAIYVLREVTLDENTGLELLCLKEDVPPAALLVILASCCYAHKPNATWWTLRQTGDEKRDQRLCAAREIFFPRAGNLFLMDGRMIHTPEEFTPLVKSVAEQGGLDTDTPVLGEETIALSKKAKFLPQALANQNLARSSAAAKKIVKLRDEGIEAERKLAEDFARRSGLEGEAAAEFVAQAITQAKKDAVEPSRKELGEVFPSLQRSPAKAKT